MSSPARIRLADVADLATLALIILTGLYVIVTYRLMRAAVEANELGRESFEQQSVLATYPQISCYARHDEKSIILRIQNSGETLAFDVDVWIFAIYSFEGDDFTSFVGTYVKDEYRREVLTALLPKLEEANDFFAISDHIVYYTMPRRRQVEIVLSALPLLPNSFDVFLQFRDVVGRNYYAVYWFFQGEDDAAGRYRLGAVQPEALGRVERLDFSGFPKNEVIAPKGESLPDGLGDQSAIWRASIPAGYLLAERGDIEDRGEWSDLP
jgi:hypothetical protein